MARNGLEINEKSSPRPVLRVLHQRFKPGARLGRRRSNRLMDNPAVAQEDQRWPELDLERSAQGLPSAVLNADVADCRELGEQLRQVWPQGVAEAAPTGAELDHDGAGESIDLGPRWLGVLKDVVHASFH